MRSRSTSTFLLSCGLCVGLGPLLAGCHSGQAGDLTGAGLTAAAPHSATLYIDWDDHDDHLDRYVQVHLRDLAAVMGYGPRNPAAAYHRAVAYEAARDSVGLARFVRLDAAEQSDRRRLAAGKHAEARRLVLAAVHHHRNLSEQGYLPDLHPDGRGLRPEGVETVVTTAIEHLVRATGLDPSAAAAWRDLAYFTGVVGDRTRQRRALGAALEALDLIDPGQAAAGDPGRLRRDLLLDLAWLAREQAQPALAVAYLDHLEPWLETPAPERDLRRHEAMLLRGLALADMDDRLAVADLVDRLPALSLRVRAGRAVRREDLRWQLGLPGGGISGFMRSAWPRRGSDVGRHWIRAMIGAPSGDPQHTVRLWHAPPTDLELPPRLASRYWQDRGRLHALADDHATAAYCYQWAAYCTPYLAFFPLRASSGPPRLDELASDRRYYTGYGLFFLHGDRGLYQADRNHGPQ